MGSRRENWEKQQGFLRGAAKIHIPLTPLFPLNPLLGMQSLWYPGCHVQSIMCR